MNAANVQRADISAAHDRRAIVVDPDTLATNYRARDGGLLLFRPADGETTMIAVSLRDDLWFERLQHRDGRSAWHIVRVNGISVDATRATGSLALDGVVVEGDSSGRLVVHAASVDEVAKLLAEVENALRRIDELHALFRSGRVGIRFTRPHRMSEPEAASAAASLLKAFAC
jgi:hypothetical protein